jgi:cell wall-associated NlpC family hydrolase
MLNRIPVFAFILLLSFSIRFPEQALSPVPDILKETPAGIDRTALINFAKHYLGIPYHRSGSEPKKGFDCSGFVSFVFKEFHIDVPRSAGEYRSLGKALKPDEFRVGDVLVFYGFRDRTLIGHVGIICEANGMKSRFIHASSGKAHSVTISDLDSEGYHRRFYKCIDVIR